MKKLIAVALLAVPLTFAQTTPAPADQTAPNAKHAKKHAKKHSKKGAKGETAPASSMPAQK